MVRLLAIALLCMLPLHAAAKPRIALILDDIGDRHVEGRRAVALPGPVALAFLPHTSHARGLAEAAHAAGKEVLLHLPLQAVEGNDLGPGAITLDTGEDAFRRIFADNLDSVPHAGGVNTHMGSLLTRHPGHMAWLMAALRERDGFYFVDSYTALESVALESAREAGVPATRRNVFLDSDPDPGAIAAEFVRLVELARRDGSALGIGHPYPETLDVLEDMLRDLDAHGVELVTVRELIDLQETGRTWHASSYR